MIRSKVQVWITYPSRFSKQAKVHAAYCRFAGSSHGFWEDAGASPDAVRAKLELELHKPTALVRARCCL